MYVPNNIEMYENSVSTNLIFYLRYDLKGQDICIYKGNEKKYLAIIYIIYFQI